MQIFIRHTNPCCIAVHIRSSLCSDLHSTRPLLHRCGPSGALRASYLFWPHMGIDVCRRMTLAGSDQLVLGHGQGMMHDVHCRRPRVRSFVRCRGRILLLYKSLARFEPGLLPSSTNKYDTCKESTVAVHEILCQQQRRVAHWHHLHPHHDNTGGPVVVTSHHITAANDIL